MYGISQNPDTKDYIIVFPSCDKCGERYANINFEWCKLCWINNFKNWISENEMIDDLIKEMRLKINSQWDKIFEWIAVNQFNNIQGIGKGAAIWKDGPLNYDKNNEKYTRESDEKIALKCYNSKNINEFLNEVLNFSINLI